MRSWDTILPPAKRSDSRERLSANQGIGIDRSFQCYQYQGNARQLDFEIKTLAEMLKMLNSITGMLTLLLAAIAGISLFVGGISIMNIMYVTVTERTKEFGLRMSIGARSSNIMMQFLSESIILSLLGGAIGILLGVGIAYLVINLLGWTYNFNLLSIIVAFVACTITGVFFGWYPARKAANLDPIVALRYE